MPTEVFAIKILSFSLELTFSALLAYVNNVPFGFIDERTSCWIAMLTDIYGTKVSRDIFPLFYNKKNNFCAQL